MWNSWRFTNSNIRPDLNGADLTDAHLSKCNLRHADLSLVDLWGADLWEADFTGADLTKADFTGANLRGANLTYSDLSEADLNKAHLRGAKLREAKLNWAALRGADLSEADLREADLRGADLSGADLSGANLNKANLREAKVNEAHFDDSLLANTDLYEVMGLESVIHDGPSSIGIDTFFRSRGTIPEVFLLGAGVPDIFLEYATSLGGKAIEFYSAFISYSSKDEELAKRLYADLQAKGVRCWFAPEDLKTGDKFRLEIDAAVRTYDKLLLLLSKRSIKSGWVEKEVETAFENERKQKRTVLFPVRLDGAVMKIESGWPADIRRTRHIGDFTKWKDTDAYQNAFDRLLRDLKAEKAPVSTPAKTT